jgi:hypothetical protein
MGGSLVGCERAALRARNSILECVAKFERLEGGYRMVADGEEVLVATLKGRSAGELAISCGGQSYEAQADLLRNFAVASYLERGERAVRLSGGLLGRGYEALLATGDG